MLTIQGVTYIHPNGDLLFADLNLSINKHDKIALIGNNGSGKSTLLKILARELQPSSGLVRVESTPYHIPQIFGQFNNYAVSQALQIDAKLEALKEILKGNATEQNFAVLDNDWNIKERCKEALSYWGLEEVDLNQKVETLSGGQKTKVFLAGISIHQPEIVLLDEPSNHLDSASRDMLYGFIRSTKHTLIIVSHDRTLLNLLNLTYELNKHGITAYGGNYDFYLEQKNIEMNALTQELKNKEKAIRKAKEVERTTMERQQKLDARGKKKQEKAGLPTIMMKTFKNNAEKSTSRIKGIHAEKIDNITDQLSLLRKELPDLDKMKLDLDDSSLHKGKILVTASGVNFKYNSRSLWPEGLDFQLSSGDRVVIKGSNGSGKTTLIKIILGDLQPSDGSIDRVNVKAIYIDQDYSLINSKLTVYEQAQCYNSGHLQEHEIKIRLNRFLFSKTTWDKPCEALSGGERMRLMLCSLTINSQTPDIIILDEPTNNLDIQNIEILTAAINEYFGTLIVVSHDEYFINEINVNKAIMLT
ncbi:ABC-F family ATP-binding cassette domain-containing protein [Chryseosolibacter indicus]|uniref:ATP-binding cassette domain-containing protein n=1 Tax=Chryseosolibacter indicus TaxID=2782351 RepID=A0ABS5VQT8_9BACT|nr:ABC-F family ATP-binding cassette domain-containing protein [Chryseosolibacter indicus]MBT1703810.1 ATP-binding cassette domain-containing protein [Chryseosolibacter indicus]